MTVFWDVSHWLDYYADTPEFLVDGLVPASATLVIGEPMAGKSLLALDLATALSTGDEWLGRAVQGGPHRVAFLVTDPGAVAETSRRWKDRTGASTGLLVGQFDTGNPEGWQRIAEGVEDDGTTVLVLDNLLGALAGDVNSAKDCRVLTDGLNLVLSTGAAVIAVHHTGKAGEHGPGRSPLGSQHLKAWPRSVLRLSHRGGPDRRALTTESNSAEPLDLSLSVHWTGRAARFDVLTEKAVNERSRERSKETLDKVAAMAEFILTQCPTETNVSEVSRRLEKQFGGKESTHRSDLIRGKLSSQVHLTDGRWHRKVHAA